MNTEEELVVEQRPKLLARLISSTHQDRHACVATVRDTVHASPKAKRKPASKAKAKRQRTLRCQEVPRRRRRPPAVRLLLSIFFDVQTVTSFLWKLALCSSLAVPS